MSLFGRKEKQELEFLRSQMTPQQLEAADLAMKIKSAREELADITAKIAKESSALSKLKKQVIETDERVLLQSFGFYVPHYAYTTSDEYKEKLSSVRAQQKELVKSKCATTGRTDWEVNGSKSKGAKMVRDMQKLLLRAFNAENYALCFVCVRRAEECVAPQQFSVFYRFVRMRTIRRIFTAINVK